MAKKFQSFKASHSSKLQNKNKSLFRHMEFVLGIIFEQLN